MALLDDLRDALDDVPEPVIRERLGGDGLVSQFIPSTVENRGRVISLSPAPTVFVDDVIVPETVGPDTNWRIINDRVLEFDAFHGNPSKLANFTYWHTAFPDSQLTGFLNRVGSSVLKAEILALYALATSDARFFAKTGVRLQEDKNGQAKKFMDLAESKMKLAKQLGIKDEAKRTSGLADVDVETKLTDTGLDLTRFIRENDPEGLFFLDV